MRPVYMISGGITKFSKAEPRKSFRVMVKEAFDYAMRDAPIVKAAERVLGRARAAGKVEPDRFR